MSYWEEAHRFFESEAALLSQTRILISIRESHGVLQPFSTYGEVLYYLRGSSTNLDRKDEILLALLQAHQGVPGGGAFTLLAAAMFPMLSLIYGSRLTRHVHTEADDLWGCVVDAFAEAIDGYPTDRRQKRIAANLRGETLAALRRARAVDIALEDVRRVIATEVVPLLSGRLRADERSSSRALRMLPFRKDHANPTHGQDVEDADRSLDQYLTSGLIDASDRFFILGTHLYDCSLSDLAAQSRVGINTAKSRLSRALARIRKGSGTPGPKAGIKIAFSGASKK